MTDERSLSGGWVTQGVVRVGETVRRPLGPNAEFVHRLLEHLDTVGFGAAPRFLGIDEAGREILSFIDGEVPSDTRALAWDDTALAGAAELLRRYHDATTRSKLRGTFEVVCHNDVGPWNIVWRDDVPVGLIDFDNAAPGTRIDDLGYAAWKHLNLGLLDIPVAEQRRRLCVFAESYGVPPDERLLRAIASAQSRMRSLIERAPDRGRASALPQNEREQRWLRENGPALVR